MSWNQLLSIYKEATHRFRLEQAEKPTSCPNDGVPLQAKGNILHCPFDGYVWPETTPRNRRFQ